MNLDQYSKQALTTLTHEYDMQDISPSLMGQILGLAGESGEIAEKIKKSLRDNKGILTDEDKQDLKKELGDVLWYVNSVAYHLGFTLEEVAHANLEKLASRKERNVLHGRGDDR